MKKKILSITLAIVALAGAYCLGTTQAETITEVNEAEKVVEIVPDNYINTDSYEFYNNYVDMRKVVYYEVEDGLELYMEDGSGYYLER